MVLFSRPSAGGSGLYDTEMRHLLDPATWNSLKDWLAERGQPAFRAAQIRKWVFEGRADTFEAMSDLPKSLRADLAADFQLWTGQVVRHLKSADGTEKMVIEVNAESYKKGDNRKEV